LNDLVREGARRDRNRDADRRTAVSRCFLVAPIRCNVMADNRRHDATPPIRRADANDIAKPSSQDLDGFSESESEALPYRR